jgi:hypothetical protein
VQAAFPRHPACGSCRVARPNERCSARTGGARVHFACGWRCTRGRPSPMTEGDYVAPALNRLSQLCRPATAVRCSSPLRSSNSPETRFPMAALTRSGRAPPPRPARAGAGLPTPAS